MKNLTKKFNKHLNAFKDFRKNPQSNLNTFITFTAGIMIGRGIWDLLDYYLLPNCHRLSCIICIIIGLLILLVDDGKIDELGKFDI